MTPSVNRNNPSGPLSKYKFFFSGIDKAHSIDSRIRKLGGQLITIDKDTSEKAHGTIFFLSDYTFWRRPKYIFAAALGVPMLHYEWYVSEFMAQLIRVCVVPTRDLFFSGLLT